jgi:hypothetical protein
MEFGNYIIFCRTSVITQCKLYFCHCYIFSLCCDNCSPSNAYDLYSMNKAIIFFSFWLISITQWHTLILQSAHFFLKLQKRGMRFKVVGLLIPVIICSITLFSQATEVQYAIKVLGFHISVIVFHQILCACLCTLHIPFSSYINSVCDSKL